VEANEQKHIEQSRWFCIYPLHYNIINHRDKEEKERPEKRRKNEIGGKRDNDASAYTNFEEEFASRVRRKAENGNK
jgi:hypothetical protein